MIFCKVRGAPTVISLVLIPALMSLMKLGLLQILINLF